MEKCFLIIDFSTRLVQANLVDINNGKLLDSRMLRYEIMHENPGWSEINIDDIWLSMQKVTHDIITKNKNKYEVVALGFSWFGDNLLLTNQAGDPLDNLVLSFDYRAKDEAQKLIDEFGEENLFGIVGYEPISAGLIPAKILWYKRHKPEIFSEATRFLSLQQYIFLKLGLGAVSDLSLACRKNMFDIKNQCWSEELCDYLGIPISQMGDDVLPANTIFGRVSQIGDVKLPGEIPVLLGVHNSVSGMLGLGSLPNFSPILTEVLGTFDILGFLTNIYHEDHASFFSCYNGPFKDSYVVAGSTISSTDVEWGLKTLYQRDHPEGLDEILSECPLDGRNQVILSKGIQTGEGLLRGMNLTTTRIEMFQAILEGVTFPLIGIINQQSLINQRKFNTVRCGGKGALYERLLQLKADVYNLPVEKSANVNVSALGAAIMLAVELGYSPDYETAVSGMISIEKTFEPRPEIAQRYRERYVDYLEIS